MFLWYKNAEVCYAYQVDVIGTDPAAGEFAASRWYTRGWTLQELLTPRTVIFKSKYWKVIGSKEELVHPISTITKIYAHALEGADMDSFSVAQRMSWASKRVTTRIEDTAYCLLGIFNANIPLLYGEGYKSFRRLQEEVINNSADQSIFAWVKEIGFINNLSISVRGMLADSPSDFVESGNIVAFQERGVDNPHSMTNKGLRIQFPVLTSANSTDVIVILACRYQDNTIGPLGVRLLPWESMGDKERYMRVWTRMPRVEGFHFGVKALERDPGLFVIPLKQAIHAVRKSMFVGWRGGYSLKYKEVFILERTFLVSELPSRDYRLSGVYPAGSWDENQHFLTLTNDCAPPLSNSLRAVMLFRSDRLDLVGFIVILGHFVDGVRKVWCDVRKDGPDVSLRDVWFHNSLPQDRVGEKGFEFRSLSEGCVVRVELESRMMLGKDIYNVRFGCDQLEGVPVENPPKFRRI